MRIISVGMSTCGISAGADKVYEKIDNLLQTGKYDNVQLKETGCIGMCYAEPLVEIRDGENWRLIGNSGFHDFDFIRFGNRFLNNNW
jgi:NADH:ubiquinone oxidoreductase subunit E